MPRRPCAAALPLPFAAAAAAGAAPPPPPPRSLTPYDLPPLPPALAKYNGTDAETYVQRGAQRFERGDVAASVVDFDHGAALDPGQLTRLWQRGISLYYLERTNESAAQFENDFAANPDDSEESIWRFVAQCRGGMSVAAARRGMLKVGYDSRPVMRAAFGVFSGDAPPQALDDAGGAANGTSDRFYADLYLGLWYEASGDAAAAAARVLRAAASAYGPSGDFGLGDYMWHVSRVHCSRRGWCRLACDAAAACGRACNTTEGGTHGVCHRDGACYADAPADCPHTRA